jgi:hypothetical protein
MKVRDHGRKRADVERYVEGLVELGMLLEEGVILKPRDEDQVSGGGDRQELRQPLDDPEQQRL